MDQFYKEIGIIHMTETTAINLVRSSLTGFANIFGMKGFDKLRNKTLKKLESLLKENQKVCNIRMEQDSPIILCNIYGTLLEKQ